MDLKYNLGENPLTERDEDYTAHVQPSITYDREGTIDLIVNSGTLVTRTDTVAVFNLFEEVVSSETRKGCTFNLPLFNTSFSISGVFDGPLDSFDPSRHKLNVNVTKGTLLRDAEKNIKLTKTNAYAAMPQIQEVKDCLSGSVNELLTAGGVIELRGHTLKIDGDATLCGLWFITETGEELMSPVIIENRPSKIIAMIPAIPEGVEKLKVTVKIVTQYSTGGRLLKTLKQCTYSKNLFIVS
ncbi:MAG: DUF4469 domain-containing protein [Cytophagaceae bacterium]|jgi:hypothetical protein|nr:DUF4469 domain-containing protein [Cytophagaceae bacterium]